MISGARKYRVRKAIEKLVEETRKTGLSTKILSDRAIPTLTNEYNPAAFGSKISSKKARKRTLKNGSVSSRAKRASLLNTEGLRPFFMS
jgi:hypothetical protein